jgi:hypothetical protein
VDYALPGAATMRRLRLSIELEGHGKATALAAAIPSDPEAGILRPRVMWLLLVDAEGEIIDPNAHEEELIALERRAISEAGVS